MGSHDKRLHCVLDWGYVGDLGMSGFKGTPGPWSVSFHGPDNCWIVDSEKDSAVAKVTKYRADGDLQRANFNLIAAAPELLEALQEIWDSCCTNAASKPSKKALLMAHAAIKKAIGE